MKKSSLLAATMLALLVLAGPCLSEGTRREDNWFPTML